MRFFVLMISDLGHTIPPMDLHIFGRLLIVKTGTACILFASHYQSGLFHPHVSIIEIKMLKIWEEKCFDKINFGYFSFLLRSASTLAGGLQFIPKHCLSFFERIFGIPWYCLFTLSFIHTEEEKCVNVLGLNLVTLKLA